MRYPGGKSRALSKLFQYIPDLKNYKEFREPFIGGGSVALEVTKRYPDIEVWVNDLYEPLYNFWCILRDRPDALYMLLKAYKDEYSTPDAARRLFDYSKDDLNESESDLCRAAAFYVVNKCSFSGLTESSSFSPQASVSNFSMNGIEKIPGYGELIKDWKITNYSYESLLMTDDKSVFVYLDPPYDIKDNLYGRKGSMHKGFDHDKFAADCDRYNVHQLVSYNNSQLVKERFQGWTVGEFAHTYTMRSTGSYNTDQASRHELVVYNYEM